MWNGIPLVIAGGTEDKPVGAARAEWAGIAANLRTGKPTKEQIREAVDEVIGNKKYRLRAVEIEKEMAEDDPVGVVAQNIDDLGAGVHLIPN